MSFRATLHRHHHVFSFVDRSRGMLTNQTSTCNASHLAPGLEGFLVLLAARLACRGAAALGRRGGAARLRGPRAGVCSVAVRLLLLLLLRVRVTALEPEGTAGCIDCPGDGLAGAVAAVAAGR